MTSGFEQAELQGKTATRRVERRLAAILAADVAGYGRLVGADEQGALDRWRAHWDELIKPEIDQHRGRIVRTTGDGILVEFASVVNAVHCAVALQRGLARRNANISADRRIEFRMGVNVGDVIIDRGDMWGDGVNVAARLEALAEPGGLCVSGRVHEDVRGKVAVAFDDLGSRELKNIARPVRIYRARLAAVDQVSPTAAGPVTRSGMGGASILTPRGPALRSGHRLLAGLTLVGVVSSGLAWWGLAPPGPRLTASAVTKAVAPPGEVSITSTTGTQKASALSIAVLPFVNLSGDASQDYVADGITESLTGDLSHALPGSFVVSRGTAFSYKGRLVDARQIGRELEVSYLLTGSVLPEGQRVRVNTELADTSDARQLWAERFDAERSGILQVQDEIVGRLSRAIGLKVVDVEAQRSERDRPNTAEAIDLLMRGRAMLNRTSSPGSLIGTRELFEKALIIEPASVDALAGIATTLVFEFLNGYYETGGRERLRRAELLLDRALTAEPRHLMAMKAKAALLRTQGRFDDGIEAAAAVIAENPGEPWAYKEVGLSTLYLGRAEAALDWFAKAERIGPRDPGRWTWLDGRGQALILLGRDDEAVRALSSAIEASARNSGSYAFLASALALLGRPDEARAALARYNQIHPRERVSTFRKLAPVPLDLTSLAYQQQRERLKEGLRKAGMPE